MKGKKKSLQQKKERKFRLKKHTYVLLMYYPKP